MITISLIHLTKYYPYSSIDRTENMFLQLYTTLYSSTIFLVKFYNYNYLYHIYFLYNTYNLPNITTDI